MASRDIKDLHPLLKEKWEKHEKAFQEAFPGCDLFITCSYRPLDEQAKLYAQGRTTPGAIVTKAKPGQSYHNHYPSLAYDVAISIHGKLDWDVLNKYWKKCSQIGILLGLEQLSFEKAHFQLNREDLKKLGIVWPKL